VVRCALQQLLEMINGTVVVLLQKDGHMQCLCGAVCADTKSFESSMPERCASTQSHLAPPCHPVFTATLPWPSHLGHSLSQPTHLMEHELGQHDGCLFILRVMLQ